MLVKYYSNVNIPSIPSQHQRSSFFLCISNETKQISADWERLEFYEETTLQIAFGKQKLICLNADTRGLRNMGTT